MCTQSKVCFAALFAISLAAYGNLNEIHSNIQKFSGTDNSTLFEALKDRLSEIETEEME